MSPRVLADTTQHMGHLRGRKAPCRDDMDQGPGLRGEGPSPGQEHPPWKERGGFKIFF